MGRARKTMDLSFGADIEAIGALHSPTFRDADGRAFEFKAQAPNTPNLPSLLATGLSLIQSKNERSFSRKNTNGGLHKSLVKFLAWADGQSGNVLNAQGLAEFRNHLFDELAPNTAYGHYAAVGRACAALIDAGLVAKFAIPANASRAQVASSGSSSGASMATALDGAMDGQCADDANEAIMKTWLAAAWSELGELFARIERGGAWRAEAGASWDLPNDLGAYLALMSLDRAQALSLCKSICVKHLGGQAPQTIKLSKTDTASSWKRSIDAIGTRFASGKEPNIKPAELAAAIADGAVGVVEIPAWAAAPTIDYAVGKEERVKLIVQCLQREFGGFPFHASIAQNFPGLARSKWLDAIRFLLTHAYTSGEKVFIPEIASHFYPPPAMAGLALSILCAAQINPSSAMHLKISGLTDDPSNPDQARVMWEKGRAGGPQASLPFPKGSPGAKTIPRLWEKLLKASAELRSLALNSQRENLLLWTNGDTGSGWLGFVAEDGNVSALWRTTRNYLAGDINSAKPSPKTAELITPIRQHLPKITLALLRNTAINISSARLDRDFKATAAMDGRKSTQVLESSYLANAQTKDRLDQQIRQGQEALDQWLREPPVVVPEDKSMVMSELGVDEAQAKSLLEEELNNGMGASLLNGRAIFIDLPINALRIIQWLEKLEEAKPRLLCDNPSRWEAVYQPQIGLYKEALHSFSRSSVAAARAMSTELKLPFPPIY